MGGPKRAMQIIDEQTGLTEAETGFEMRHGSSQPGLSSDSMSQLLAKHNQRQNHTSQLSVKTMPKLNVNVSLLNAVGKKSGLSGNLQSIHEKSQRQLSTPRRSRNMQGVV